MHGSLDPEEKVMENETQKTKFLMFTKHSCGPCGLVKKYITALSDSRDHIIEEIYLEDFSDTPIAEEDIAIAKKYGVTATPVLVITNERGELLETFTGGVPITQNIRKLWSKYEIPHKD